MNIPSICLSVCLSVSVISTSSCAGGSVRPSWSVGPRGVESPSHPVIITATSPASYRDEMVPTDRRTAKDRKGFLFIHPTDVRQSEYFVNSTVLTLTNFHCCPSVRPTIILRNIPTDYRDNVCLSVGDITVKGCCPTLSQLLLLKTLWTYGRYERDSPLRS